MSAPGQSASLHALRAHGDANFITADIGNMVQRRPNYDPPAPRANLPNARARL